MLVVGLTPMRLAAQQSRPCVTADSTAAMLTKVARAAVTDTSAHAQAFRARFGIPAGSGADISLVRDDATCEAVTAAVESHGSSQDTEALVVIQIGTVTPFYFASRRLERGGGDVQLLNAQLSLLTVLR